MLSVIDTGNITSLCLALDRLGADYVITRDRSRVERSSAVIFPGQGRAGSTMSMLNEQGLTDVLRTWTKPYLGICLGMQLLGDFSEEDNVATLSVFPGVTTRFASTLITPHMGWNPVRLEQSSPLTAGIADQTSFYYVHSFYLDEPGCQVIGTTAYGQPFPAIVRHQNFHGVQFHPEKSGPAGIQLLMNFVSLC